MIFWSLAQKIDECGPWRLRLVRVSSLHCDSDERDDRGPTRVTANLRLL